MDRTAIFSGDAPVKGQWPTPGVDTAEALAAKRAADWPVDEALYRAVRQRRRVSDGDRPLPLHLEPHRASASARRSNTAPGLPRRATQRSTEGPVTATRHRADLTRHPLIELAGDGLSAGLVPVEVHMWGGSGSVRRRPWEWSTACSYEELAAAR
jgi:hypothetical protein